MPHYNRMKRMGRKHINVLPPQCIQSDDNSSSSASAGPSSVVVTFKAWGAPDSPSDMKVTVPMTRSTPPKKNRFDYAGPKVDSYGYQQREKDARCKLYLDNSSKESEAFHATLALYVADELDKRPELERTLMENAWLHVDRMVVRENAVEPSTSNQGKAVRTRMEVVGQVARGVLLMSDPSRLYRQVWRACFTPYEIKELAAIVTLRYLAGHVERSVFVLEEQGWDAASYIDVVEQEVLPNPEEGQEAIDQRCISPSSNIRGF